jgi:hypothetical protein
MKPLPIRMVACGPLPKFNSRFRSSGVGPRSVRRRNSKCWPSLREGALRCSALWAVAQLASFAALTALKQVRRVRSRSALRARPQDLRSSAAHSRPGTAPPSGLQAVVAGGAWNTNPVTCKGAGGVWAQRRARSREAQACWPRAPARFVNMLVAACLNVASAASEVSSATGQQAEHRRAPWRSQDKQSALCPHPARRLARADAGVRKRTLANDRNGPQADARSARVSCMPCSARDARRSN